jgi:hypothetical protein
MQAAAAAGGRGGPSSSYVRVIKYSTQYLLSIDRSRTVRGKLKKQLFVRSGPPIMTAGSGQITADG